MTTTSSVTGVSGSNYNMELEKLASENLAANEESLFNATNVDASANVTSTNSIAADATLATLDELEELTNSEEDSVLNRVLGLIFDFLKNLIGILAGGNAARTNPEDGSDGVDDSNPSDGTEDPSVGDTPENGDVDNDTDTPDAGDTDKGESTPEDSEIDKSEDVSMTYDEANAFAQGEAEIKAAIEAKKEQDKMLEKYGIEPTDYEEYEKQLREEYAKNNPEYAAAMEKGQQVIADYNKAMNDELANWDKENPAPVIPEGETTSEEYEAWLAKKEEFLKQKQAEYIAQHPSYALIEQCQDYIKADKLED